MIGNPAANSESFVVTATVRYPSLQVRDMVLGSGMATGAGVSYDRLEELVAKLQRA